MAPKTRRCSLCGVDPSDSPKGAIEEALVPVNLRLNALFALMFVMLYKEVKMANEVDALVAQVAAVQGTEASAKMLIEKAVTLLEGAISTGDMQKVIDATASLKAATDPLAAAVAAGGPVIDPPPAPPV